jgi:hypothetical protein
MRSQRKATTAALLMSDTAYGFAGPMIRGMPRDGVTQLALTSSVTM